MGKINWGRVFLCGILTGGIWYLLSLLAFLFALRGTEFAAAVNAGGPAIPGLPFLLYLVGGIWIMWLYAAIRPRYGPGPKTAAIAGLAIWVIGGLVEVNWVSHRLVVLSPGALVAPLGAALPVAIVAAVVGAWPYEE